MNEARNNDPSLFSKSKRRLALAAAPLALAAACSGNPQNTEAEQATSTTAAVSAAETLAATTPEERAKAIATELNQGNVVRGVNVAIDHHLIYPTRDQDNHPDGIMNPLILGENTYGYISYDDATVLQRC